MPPKCTICIHPKRTEIDKLLVAQSETFRTLADRFGRSQTALKRHKSEHLPSRMVKANEVRETLQADDLLGQVKALRNKAISILGKAEQAGDYRTALQGIREARSCIELLMEVQGELDRGTDVHVYNAPVLQQVIMVALKPYPEARIAAAEALASMEAS